MPRALRALVLSGTLLLLGAPGALAQIPDWRPPSKQMPQMPGQSDLAGDWVSSHGDWFRGVDRVAGVATAGLRGAGEPAGGGAFRVARFMSGPIPAVIWSDRNGDRRADMIEILKSGGVIIQLIDADYDGAANVLRVYDASGALLREERM